MYFNCEDTYNNISYGDRGYDYASACEVWRIIGVFEVEGTVDGKIITEKRVKIVRDSSLISASWDSSSDGSVDGETAVNLGYGINQWGPSTYIDENEVEQPYKGADLMQLLNGYYISKQGTTCLYCRNSNQEICSNDCSATIKQLSNTSLNMIEKSVWKLGAPTIIEPLSLSKMYELERGIQTGKICSPAKYCTDKVNRTIEWEGKIGLIYPSDYGYASTDVGCVSNIYGSNSTCETSNWLRMTSGQYWTISPVSFSNGATYVWRVAASFSVNNFYAYRAHDVRPTVYLSSNVQMIGGTGESEVTETTGPYILSV